MIIACPDCTSPFELRDGDIAELVQLECPHCRFRMILDFAAANDPRLVEVGMKMASGYRSAADYRAATASRAPLHVAEPAAAANDAAARAEAAAAAEATARAEAAARARAQSEAAARIAADEAARDAMAREAQAARLTHMAADAEWDDDEGAPTRVAATALPRAEPPTTPAATAPPTTSRAATQIGVGPVVPARTGETVIGAPPRAPENRPSEETTEPARHRDDVIPPREEPRREAPVRSAEAAAPVERPARRAPEPVAMPDPDLDLDERKKPGIFGALVLVLLLVLAVGVTIASVIRKNTPDPRPLLEDLYRQYLR